MTTPKTREAAALDYNPWGFDESDYRVLSNRFVTTRRPSECAICFDPIPAGSRARSQSEILEGQAKTFRFCMICCDAMATVALREDDGEALQARHDIGSKSQEAP